MDIKKEINITLTPDDLKKLVIDYLKLKGIKVENIYFDINGHEADGDYFSTMALVYKLDAVKCRGIEI